MWIKKKKKKKENTSSQFKIQVELWIQPWNTPHTVRINGAVRTLLFPAFRLWWGALE